MVECVASYFPIYVDGKRIAYQFDVKIGYHQDKWGYKEMTERADDVTKFKNRKIVELVMKDKIFLYDSMRQLFTPEKMDDIKALRIAKDDLPKDIAVLLQGNGVIEVSVTPNAEKPSLDLADWSEYDRTDVWRNEDRTLRNFYELLTTFPAVRRGFIIVKNSIYGDEEKFLPGLVVRTGAKKGVQFIQDGSGVQPVLSLDFVKKIFYPSGANFSDVLNDCRENRYTRDQTESLFKKVKLRSVVNPARIMNFKTFGERASECVVEMEDGQITLLDFYSKHKGIALKHPEECVILMNGAHGDFPPEVLEIAPNQSVPLNRLSPEMDQEQKKLNVVKPFERHQLIMTVFGDLNLNNETTRAFGVTIKSEMTPVKFQKLPFPQAVMTFRNKPTVVLPDPNGGLRLRSEQFVFPAKIATWVVIYADNKRNADLIPAFVNRIQEVGVFRGMTMKNGILHPVRTTNLPVNQWKALFEELRKQHGTTYFMIAGNPEDGYYEIKAAEVQLPGVITQFVKCPTISNVINKNNKSTVDNIIYKMNLKAGGLNGSIKFNEAAKMFDLEQPVLVIGLDVNHPTGENYIGPQTQPSVVGFAANYDKQSCAFMGDYFFQQARTETIDVEMLQVFTERAVRCFIANRGCQPKRVIVLRDGVSEGQYTDIVDRELQAVRNGVTKSCKQRVEFNLVVLTKTHVVRHFAKTPQINSLAPGTFINDGARKDLTQFYFAAHRAIQGTSQDLLATILVNDSKASMSCYQHFLHGLCHLHELSGTPVSLPEPVYQADVLAEYGSEILKVLWSPGAEDVNYADLTARFSRGKDRLPPKRFSA